MKNIEDMTLEELIEYDKKHPVLSNYDFYLIKYTFLLFGAGLFTSPITYNTIHNLFINPTWYNSIFSGISSTLIPLSMGLVIKRFKNIKYFSFAKDYKTYRNNLLIKKEITKLYNNLLTELSNEIDNSKLDNDPVSISILINYLLPHGYLSYTKTFHVISDPNLYEINNYSIYSDLDGLGVISGYGCCRHINSFIADLLNIRGISCDKVPCIYGNYEFLRKKINNIDFIPNHLIAGYIENNEYYFIDSFNNTYTYDIYNDYYINENNNGFIPIFDGNFYTKLHCDSYITNTHIFNREEINEIKNKVFMMITTCENERFNKFKLEHFEVYKKIAYLSQLELYRNEEKEKLKLKRI